MSKKEENTPNDQTSPIIIINGEKRVVTGSESRILIYLYHVPDILKSTQKIHQKFIDLWQNYNGLCIKLRTMKMKGLLTDFLIKGGKEKAWDINKKYRDQIYNIALKVHQSNPKMLENEDVLQKNDENCNENTKNCKEKGVK